MGRGISARMTGMALAVGMVAASAVAPGAGEAQEADQIRRLDVIIPFSAGGGTDTIIRQLMEDVRPRLDARIAITNVPGDGGLLGLSRLARATGDDTAAIGLLNPPSTTLAQLVRGDDAAIDIRTLTPIAGYGATFTVIATSPESGIESFEELQAAYESGEERLLAGSDRAGAAEVTAELLRDQVDLPFAEYVAYDGSGAAVAAIVRNEVPAGLAAHSAVIEGVEAGTLVPLLALGREERHPGLPETPTAVELGYPSLGEVAAAIRIVVGPPDMAQGARDQLVDLFRDVVTDPEVVERMAAAGTALDYMTPEEVEAAVAAQFDTLEGSDVLTEVTGR